MVASIYVSVLSVTSTMLIRRPCGLNAGPRLTAAAADFESHALLLGPVRFREKAGGTEPSPYFGAEHTTKMLRTTEKKKKAAAKSLLKHITQGLLQAALAFFPLFGASKMNGRIMSKIEISIQSSGNLITLSTALHITATFKAWPLLDFKRDFHE